MITPKKLLLPGILAVLITGCESNHFFQSETTLNKDIQRNWKMELYYENKFGYEETWTFNDGALTVLSTVQSAYPDSLYFDTYNDVIDNDTKDTLVLNAGNYTITADIDQAYLKITGLTKTDPEYNKKWTIVQLDGNILDIAGNYNSSGGLMEREFRKQE